MLESVELVNFRCFRQARVRLAPLTAIVGPNGSGKTSLLRAIAAYNLGGIRDQWRKNERHEATIVWRAAHGRSRRCVIALGGSSMDGAPTFSGQYVHLNPTAMREHRQLQQEARLSDLRTVAISRTSSPRSFVLNKTSWPRISRAPSQSYAISRFNRRVPVGIGSDSRTGGMKTFGTSPTRSPTVRY